MSQQNKSTGKAPAAPALEPYTLPPIFWNDADEEPKQVTRPIYLVYVSTIDKAGEKIPLDCTPIDGLPTFPHQLGEKYGVPVVELIARDQGGLVVARVTHRCRVTQAAPAGAAPNAAASGATSTTSSMSEALALVTSINDRTDKLMGMLIASKDQSNALIVETISKMSGARMIDQQDLLGQLLKQRGGGGGGGGVDKGELATFMKGIDWAQKMMAAGVEEDDETGLEGLMSTAVKEFMRAKAEGAGAQQVPQQRPRPRAVPDPEDG